MRDEFMDMVESNPEMIDYLRSGVLDNRVGIFPDHPFHSGHQKVIDLALEAINTPLIIAMGNRDHSVVHKAPSSVMGPTSFDISGRFVHLEINYEWREFFDRLNYDIPLDDSDKNLPEWQKRRNASANAKQALIDKMKAKRNAR